MKLTPSIKKELIYLKDNPIIGRKLGEYFQEHVEKHHFRNFYVAKKPLHVFKALRGDRISSLVIPVGAHIFTEDVTDSHRKKWSFPGDIPSTYLLKMRASRAIPVLIINPYTGEECHVACSKKDPLFEYRVGRETRPANGFSYEEEECAGGIHFFLNLGHALGYMGFNPLPYWKDPEITYPL